jgi:site-specific DNA-cytosine methylase
MIRTVEELQPPLVLLENVRGFEKYLQDAFNMIHVALPRHLAWRVMLDPRKMGSPNSRPRLYLLLACTKSNFNLKH